MKRCAKYWRPFSAPSLRALLSMLMVVLLGTAASAAKVNIAVLPFDGAGFDSLELKAMSIRFESMVCTVDSFVVIERQRIDNILKEQGFNQSGCVNTNCAVEIGQLLGVDKIIYGNVMSMTGVIMSDIKIVDVHSGKIDKAIMDNCQSCAKNEYILSRLPTLAAKVSQPALPASAPQLSPAPVRKVQLKPILAFSGSTFKTAEDAFNVIGGMGLVIHKNSELGIECHIPVSSKTSLIGSLLTYNYHFFLGDFVTVSPGVVGGVLKGKLQRNLEFGAIADQSCRYFAGFSIPLEIGYKFLFVKAELRTLLGNAPGTSNDQATFYTVGLSYYPHRQNN